MTWMALETWRSWTDAIEFGVGLELEKGSRRGISIFRRSGGAGGNRFSEP